MRRPAILPERKRHFPGAEAQADRYPVSGVFISEIFNRLIAVIVARDEVQGIGQSIGETGACGTGPVRLDRLTDALQTVVSAADGEIYLTNPGIAITGAAVLTLGGKINAVTGDDQLGIVKVQAGRLKSSGQRNLSAGINIGAIIGL